MSEFETYIDDLAKRGLIDGNLCEKITAAHKKSIAMNGKEYALRLVHAYGQTTVGITDSRESVLIHFSEKKMFGVNEGERWQLLYRNVGEWQVEKEVTK